MWRALFLAVGFYCCLVGLKVVVIERAILRPDVGTRLPDNSLLGIHRIASGQVEVAPPDWLPWSIMVFGVVVILYTFALPKRIRG
jgi:hypothetical protein